MAGKNNSGALFKNDRKEGMAQGAPDYTGTCLVDGAAYRIAAWLKESKSGGKKYMSLSFQEDTKSREKIDPDVPF